MVQVWGKGPEEAVAKRPRAPTREEALSRWLEVPSGDQGARRERPGDGNKEESNIRRGGNPAGAFRGAYRLRRANPLDDAADEQSAGQKRTRVLEGASDAPGSCQLGRRHLQPDPHAQEPANRPNRPAERPAWTTMGRANTCNGGWAHRSRMVDRKSAPNRADDQHIIGPPPVVTPFIKPLDFQPVFYPQVLVAPKTPISDDLAPDQTSRTGFFCVTATFPDCLAKPALAAVKGVNSGKSASVGTATTGILSRAPSFWGVGDLWVKDRTSSRGWLSVKV